MSGFSFRAGGNILESRHVYVHTLREGGGGGARGSDLNEEAKDAVGVSIGSFKKTHLPAFGVVNPPAVEVVDPDCWVISIWVISL